jgi:TetR/AcrR family transcriptional regulator
MSGESERAVAAPPHVRQRILEAAESLFADKGFAATSISDITEASGVGRSLIYYYFRDKQELHDSILQDGGEQMLRIANEAYAAPGTALERLQVFMVKFRQLHVERHNLTRIAMRARLGDGPPSPRPREDFPRMSAVLARIVKEGVTRGELRKVDPEKTVRMVLGIVHSLVMMQRHPLPRSSPEQNTEFAMRMLTEGLARR